MVCLCRLGSDCRTWNSKISGTQKPCPQFAVMNWVLFLKHNCPFKLYKCLKERDNHLSKEGVQEFLESFSFSQPPMCLKRTIEMYEKDFLGDFKGENLQKIDFGYVWYGDLVFKTSENQMSTKIWNASIILYEYLRHKKFRRVLDAGCGIGWLGLTLDCESCVLQDIDELALSYCRENINMNARDAKTSVLKHDWRSEEKKIGTFDLLLLSDVWFDTDILQDQIEFVTQNLGENGFALCCCGVRDENVFEAFLSAYNKVFNTVEEITTPEFGERVIESEGRCRSGIDWIDCEMKMFKFIL